MGVFENPKNFGCTKLVLPQNHQFRSPNKIPPMQIHPRLTNYLNLKYLHQNSESKRIQFLDKTKVKQ